MFAGAMISSPWPTWSILLFTKTSTLLELLSSAPASASTAASSLLTPTTHAGICKGDCGGFSMTVQGNANGAFPLRAASKHHPVWVAATGGRPTFSLRGGPAQVREQVGSVINHMCGNNISSCFYLAASLFATPSILSSVSSIPADRRAADSVARDARPLHTLAPSCKWIETQRIT